MGMNRAPCCGPCCSAGHPPEISSTDLPDKITSKVGGEAFPQPSTGAPRPDYGFFGCYSDFAVLSRIESSITQKSATSAYDFAPDRFFWAFLARSRAIWLRKGSATIRQSRRALRNVGEFAAQHPIFPEFRCAPHEIHLHNIPFLPKVVARQEK